MGIQELAKHKVERTVRVDNVHNQESQHSCQHPLLHPVPAPPHPRHEHAHTLIQRILVSSSIQTFPFLGVPRPRVQRSQPQTQLKQRNPPALVPDRRPRPDPLPPRRRLHLLADHRAREQELQRLPHPQTQQNRSLLQPHNLQHVVQRLQHHPQRLHLARVLENQHADQRHLLQRRPRKLAPRHQVLYRHLCNIPQERRQHGRDLGLQQVNHSVSERRADHRRPGLQTLPDQLPQERQAPVDQERHLE